MFDVTLVSALFDEREIITRRVRAGTLRLGERGLETLTVTIPATSDQALTLFDHPGMLRLELFDNGSRIAVGRVEDITINNDGTVTLTAQGGWRVLSDAPYTALWSSTDMRAWQVSSIAVAPNVYYKRTPERFRTEISSRVMMTLIKSTSYEDDNSCSVYTRIPNQSRSIVGVQCVIRDLLPANWSYYIATLSDDAFQSAPYIATVAVSTGVFRLRAFHLLIPPAGVIDISIANTTGSISAPAGETGSWYLIAEHIRVVTSTDNRVNTILTAARTAGSSVVATVGSTERMYIGMELVINTGASNSELVVVEDVVNTTQFVASFINNHNAGETVQGFCVYPDEIVRDAINTGVPLEVETLNPYCAGLIQTCPRDLTNCVYEDASRADVIADLAASGDGRVRYTTGVNARGYVTFRDAELAEDLVSSPPEWMIDVEDLEIQQSLASYVNRVYARYRDATGRTLRTARQSRLGFALTGTLQRTGYVDVDTHIRAGAEARALVAARDSDQIATSYKFVVKSLYTPSGISAPLTAIEPGHVVGIRNLPPGRGGQRDPFVSFRVATVEIDLATGRLTIEPEHPVPTPEYIQAAIQRAAEFAASAGQTPGAASGTTIGSEQTRTTTTDRPSQEQIRI